MRKQNAITLISLVITIIIMLILAGVGIFLSVGENGLINTAKYARQKYLNEQKIEEESLNDLDKMLENGDYVGTENSQLIKYLNEKVYPDGMPLVPKMTSNECSIGKVTTSNSSGTREGYKAFDNVYYFGDIVKYNDLDNSWQANDNNENYIQFEFDRPIIVKSIRFIPSYTSTYGGVALKTAKLLLSNDGENFIEASDLITYTNNIKTSLQWQIIESNDIVNKYKFVRLYVNGSYTSSYGRNTAIKEMQIYGWFEK